jgi:Flp pilus assembly protein TadG
VCGDAMSRSSGMIRGSATRGPRRMRISAAVDAVSTIEFALIASILTTLAIGTLDFGMGLWQQMEVGNAARAGAEYAARHGWDSTAIQNAVTSATSLSSITASPAPAQVCGCPGATTGVTLTGQTPPCTTSCSSGAAPNTYVTVSAQASYALIVPFPGVQGPVTLTASAITRM